MPRTVPRYLTTDISLKSSHCTKYKTCNSRSRLTLWLQKIPSYSKTKFQDSLITIYHIYSNVFCILGPTYNVIYFLSLPLMPILFFKSHVNTNYFLQLSFMKKSYNFLVIWEGFISDLTTIVILQYSKYFLYFHNLL